jgi:hypothetical protein
MTPKPTTVLDHSRTCTHPSSARQYAASATNDGQTKRMAFQVAQRSLTPIHVRRIGQAHGASGGGRTWLWHVSEELDAGP